MKYSSRYQNNKRMSMASISKHTQGLAAVISMAIHSHPETQLNKVVKTEMIQCASNALSSLARHIEKLEDDNIEMLNKIKKLENEIIDIRNTKCKKNWQTYY